MKRALGASLVVFAISMCTHVPSEVNKSVNNWLGTVTMPEKCIWQQ